MRELRVDSLQQFREMLLPECNRDLNKCHRLCRVQLTQLSCPPMLRKTRMRSHQDLHRLRRDQIGLPRGLFLRFALFIVAVSVKIASKAQRDMRNNCTEPANKMATPQRSETKISFRVLTTSNTRAHKANSPHHIANASSSYSDKWMYSPKKFTRNLVLVFSLLLVSSCGPDGSTTTAETESTEIAAAVDSTNATGTSTIDAKAQFTATLLSGATFDSATVLQSQPLALWFWAPG